MSLPHTWRTDKEDIFLFTDKLAGSTIENRSFIQLGLEMKPYYLVKIAFSLRTNGGRLLAVTFLILCLGDYLPTRVVGRVSLELTMTFKPGMSSKKLSLFLAQRIYPYAYRQDPL